MGDNDRLAARMAQMVGADRLVLLSDVDGLYTADPRTDPSARHLASVEALTPELLALAGGTDAGGPGTGGMATKLAAARIAAVAGCVTVIAAGRPAGGGGPLSVAIRWTEVAAGTTPLAARKAWIAATLNSRGVIVVDAGAADALRRGASLLPAGVLAVAGTFGKGSRYKWWIRMARRSRAVWCGATSPRWSVWRACPPTRPPLRVRRAGRS